MSIKIKVKAGSNTAIEGVVTNPTSTDVAKLSKQVSDLTTSLDMSQYATKTELESTKAAIIDSASVDMGTFKEVEDWIDDNALTNSDIDTIIYTAKKKIQGE